MKEHIVIILLILGNKGGSRFFHPAQKGESAGWGPIDPLIIFGRELPAYRLRVTNQKVDSHKDNERIKP